MAKITDEMLYAFITKNLSIDESEIIQMAIDSDQRLKTKYQEIKKIRETHQEFVRDFEKKPMQKKTAELFRKSNTDRRNSFFTKFSQGPLAGLGWIGFMITGLFVFPTMTIQMAQDNKINNTMIASTNDQETKFRGLDEIIKEISLGELFELKTGSNKEFKIIVSSVSETADNLCFDIKIIYDEEMAENQSKFCLDK